jgi:hypothetical protein
MGFADGEALSLDMAVEVLLTLTAEARIHEGKATSQGTIEQKGGGGPDMRKKRNAGSRCRQYSDTVVCKRLAIGELHRTAGSLYQTELAGTLPNYCDSKGPPLTEQNTLS